MDEVINTIKRRYIHERAIYTWCGIALVAVNPYQEQDIYGEQVVETYHSAAHSVYLQLDPHIYAVTEDAYSKLELNSKDQSIIVSGESGAGKTVSAKHAMRYLASIATLSSSSSSQQQQRKSTTINPNLNCTLTTATASTTTPTTTTSVQIKTIEQRVLASNPIMEAIGNARTSRNDNSSRFGKYIQIYFDRQKRRILGANMRTYLLEKSRVTKQQVGERNFHIFYQLLNYAQKYPEKMEHLHLLQSTTTSGEVEGETKLDLVSTSSKQRVQLREFKYLNSLPAARVTSDPASVSSPNVAASTSLPAAAAAASPFSSRDDLRRFNEALRTLNVDEQRIQLIYRIIAGILHGGNVEFKVIRKDDEDEVRRDDDEDCDCEIDIENDFHFKACCQLLGLNPVELAKRLTTKLLRSGARDIIEKPQNRCKAEYGRDAMLKFVYECLFTWLVALINLSLSSKDSTNCSDSTDFTTGTQEGQMANSNAAAAATTTPKSPSAKKSILDHSQQLQQQQQPQFIGVLDIYGFENFKINSFEQFCINYANEVLQQQYNQHVFKLEQEEYIRESIDWTFIEYSDNQQVIDVIESKPIGILNLLDEECKMPKGTDKSWCAKLYDQLLSQTSSSVANNNNNNQNCPFKKPKLNYQSSFTICHYAEDVNYSVETFLEKNRDSLAEEQCELLRTSEVLSFIFEDPLLATSVKPKMRTTRSATVGWQFRCSLAALIKTLNATEPHYVRCIKPNDRKKAFEFNEKRAIEQLKACGVYETIRISNNGFPSRWLYKDFAKRYCVLIYNTEIFDKIAQQSNQITAQQQYQQLGKKIQLNENEEDEQEEEGELNIQVEGQNNFVVEENNQKRHFMCQFSSANVRPICEAICKLAYDELNSPYKHLRTEEEQSYINTLIERHGNKPSAIYQFGKTKLFFRAGQVAYLERIRGQRLREYSVTIQRHVRGWLARRMFKLRLEEHYERLRREATLASLQEQALLQQQLEREAAEAAAQEAAAAVEAEAPAARKQQEEAQLISQQSQMNASEQTSSGSIAMQPSSNGSAHQASQLSNVYHMIVDMMYAEIQPLIISAVLEYEALDQAEQFNSLDSQSSSQRSLSPQQQFNELSMENLIKQLDRFHNLIRKNNVSEEISVQAFKQIFYLINAHSLNQLLIRRDLCQFAKAMQINFNLSYLVQWCRERYLVKWKEIVEQLDPITQATKLLQTRKSSDDIATIEEVCNKLRPSQIIKILNLYTSSYEEQITTDFIHELEEYLYRVRNEKLQLNAIIEHNEQQQQQQQQLDSLIDEDENNNNSDSNNFNQNDLLMDTKYYFPFIENYNYQSSSSISLK